MQRRVSVKTRTRRMKGKKGRRMSEERETVMGRERRREEEGGGIEGVKRVWKRREGHGERKEGTGMMELGHQEGRKGRN